ncbi:MAG TPA: hypothetical protein VMX57_03410, partial [Planctomycetota bacterium]|nr:hypothetical protein [Planctomycetota bacterium]
MKDRSLVETRASDALAEAVADAADGKLSLDDARALAAQHGIAADAEFVALLFALTREGRLRRVGDEICSAAE